MKARTLVILAAALLLGLVAVVVAKPGFQREGARVDTLKAGSFKPPQQAPEFALQGSGETDVTLRRYRGKVVLLSFGFTNCAAVCPTTLSTLAQMRTGLGKAADSVQVIFVTVDPERDTREQLQKYVAAFDPTFIGATGTPATLAAVRKAYGVPATRVSTGPDYAVAHGSSIFLIDGAGKLRAMMPFGRDAADFVHDVKILLGQ